MKLEKKAEKTDFENPMRNILVRLLVNYSLCDYDLLCVMTFPFTFIVQKEQSIKTVISLKKQGKKTRFEPFGSNLKKTCYMNTNVRK